MKKITFALSLLFSYYLFPQQVLSPNWNIKQNTNFPWPGSIVRYLSVPNPNVIWATGYDNFAMGRTYNYFTTSKNGGTTYTCGTVFTDTLDYGLSSIFAHDSLNAWVAAYRKLTSTKPCDVIYKTNNGGVTWSNGGNPTMFSGSTSFANFVTFVSSSVGIAVGDPVSGDFEIYRTNNGGSTWSPISGANIPNANSNEYGMTNVYTTFGNSIWFGTDNGRIFRSSDGGQTWAVSTVTPASVYGVMSISFVNANDGLALIYTGGIYSLHRTTDGGASWTNTGPLSMFFGIDDIANIPGTNIFVSCGGNGVMNYLISYSTDHGATWIDWGGALIRYFEVAFANTNTGYAGGQANVSNANIDGMYKYSGGPLKIESSEQAPYAFNLYPNPTNSIVNIKLPAAKNGLTLTILNTMGELVYSEKINLVSSTYNYSLNLQQLTKGIYFVSIEKDGQKSIQKLIVE